MSYNPFSLSGKHILITGASSGIGEATAIECSKLGAILYITGRDEIKLKKTFEQLSGTGHQQLAADLTKESDLQHLVEFLPNLDGVVNNAGINRTLPVQYINVTDLHEIFEVNTISHILITQLLVKKKRLNKGASVVFTSSIAGVSRSSMGNSMYSATKGAINGFMKNAALELAARGVRVNSVNPAMVQTSLVGKGVVTEEQYEADRKKYPLQRYGTPRDIALSIAFLLSDASSWITGTALLIDGGITLK